MTAGVLLVLVAVLAPASHSARDRAAQATGHCSRAAADQAILALGQAEPGDQHPAAQVLCAVPVFGAGVEAMVASVKIPSCGRTANWLVWRYQDGRWQRVFESHNGADLVAVGAGIKETQFVLRPSDSHCFPTGGTRSRIWRWNGTRMASGAWRYSQPQGKTGVMHVRNFKSPSGNIVCSLGDSGTTRCVSRNHPHSAILRYDGTVRICIGRGCFGNSRGAPLPVLAYGRRNEFALYRCTSAVRGITCVSLMRGKGYGKGFLINRDGARRVG